MRLVAKEVLDVVDILDKDVWERDDTGEVLVKPKGRGAPKSLDAMRLLRRDATVVLYSEQLRASSKVPVYVFHRKRAAQQQAGVSPLYPITPP